LLLATNELVEAPLKKMSKMKDLPLRALVVVKTISRCHLANKVKELYSSACRTCSTIIFPHSTNQIIFSGFVVAVAVVLA